MGWFWAEKQPLQRGLVAPHPVTNEGVLPPASCPMHESSSPLLNTLSKGSTTTRATESPSTCPVKSPSQSSRYPTNPTEPIATTTQSQTSSSLSSSTSSSTISKLNPLNYMPTLANKRLDDSPQTVALPLEREPSSIPRGDADTNWEYPSPQQMYNAMLRKGYTDTPVDAVESMVAVHNFLNEGAWDEIVQWENIFAQGLLKGWERCREGEEGLARERARQEFLETRRQQVLNNSSATSRFMAQEQKEEAKPRLLRFQGRPSEPTPKSRILQALSRMFPESFDTNPPFDRHDWYVARTLPSGMVQERRYVIDYYGGGLQATGEPVFYLDIRPAADSVGQVAERMIRWGGDIWWRASGGAARAQPDQ